MESTSRLAATFIIICILGQACWIGDHGPHEVENLFGNYVVIKDPNNDDAGFQVALMTAPRAYSILVENSSKIYFDSAKIIINRLDAFNKTNFRLLQSLMLVRNHLLSEWKK